MFFQVALIAFSNEAVVKIHLNQYSTRKELISEIAKVTQPGGSTNTHLALEVRTQMIETRNLTFPRSGIFKLQTYIIIQNMFFIR